MVVENALCDVAKVVVRSVASEISAIHEKAQFVLFSSILFSSLLSSHFLSSFCPFHSISRLFSSFLCFAILLSSLTSSCLLSDLPLIFHSLLPLLLCFSLLFPSLFILIFAALLFSSLLFFSF